VASLCLYKSNWLGTGYKEQIDAFLIGSGPLVEPRVVPRFLAALEEAGAKAERVEAYETCLGSDASSCDMEMKALQDGFINAIAFSSTAEVRE